MQASRLQKEKDLKEKHQKSGAQYSTIPMQEKQCIDPIQESLYPLEIFFFLMNN